MTDSVFETIAWILAIILLVPVLINPAGWLVAVVLAGAVLLIYYGGRYLLDLEKQRRMGERGMISDVRYADRGDDK